MVTYKYYLAVATQLSGSCHLHTFHDLNLKLSGGRLLKIIRETQSCILGVPIVRPEKADSWSNRGMLRKFKRSDVVHLLLLTNFSNSELVFEFHTAR